MPVFMDLETIDTGPSWSQSITTLVCVNWRCNGVVTPSLTKLKLLWKLS